MKDFTCICVMYMCIVFFHSVQLVVYHQNFVLFTFHFHNVLSCNKIQFKLYKGYKTGNISCHMQQVPTDRHTADTHTTDTWTGRLFLDFPHWSLSASLYFCTQQGSETRRNSLWWNSWIRMTWKRTLKKISM